MPSPVSPPLRRAAGRAVRGKSRSDEGRNIAPQFRLGRPCAGHPRLGTAETKTWTRGTSPRKTIEHCLLRVLPWFRWLAFGRRYRYIARLDWVASGATEPSPGAGKLITI